MSSKDFRVLAKPIGPVCNLDCKHRFYLKKDLLYRNGGARRRNCTIETHSVPRALDSASAALTCGAGTPEVKLG